MNAHFYQTAKYQRFAELSIIRIFGLRSCDYILLKSPESKHVAKKGRSISLNYLTNWFSSKIGSSIASTIISTKSPINKMSTGSNKVINALNTVCSSCSC